MPRRRRINLTHRVAGASAILAIGGLVAASSAMAVAPAPLTNSDSLTQTFSSPASLNLQVPDASTTAAGATVSNQITVSGMPRNSIRWMDVYTSLGPLASDVTGTHASWGDMEVTLTHAAAGGGTRTVILVGADPNPFGGRDSPEALSDTTFADNGATVISDVSLGNNFQLPAITSAVPEGKLAAFNGMDPNGTWTLSVRDLRNIDQMQLNRWHLDIAAQTVTADHQLQNTTTTYHGAAGPIANAVVVTPAQPGPPPVPAVVQAKTTAFTVNVPTSGNIADVQVHTNVDIADFVDLEMSLVSPKGTIIPLTNAAGNFFPTWDGKVYDGVMSNTLYRDTAATPFSRANFVPGQNIAELVPEGSLSSLAGQDAKGVWTLQITDQFNSGEAAGVLNSWDLIVTTSTGFASPYTGPVVGGGGGGGTGGGGTVTISNATQCASIARVSTAKSLKAAASSKAYLAIQQAVATANKRGAAIESWLRAGITTADLCGGAIGQADLSVASGAGTSLQAIDTAKPRTVAAPTAKRGKKSVVVTLARAKALQASSVAAVKRAKALDARINGNLTGGDLVDGAITTAKLNRGLVVTGTSGASAARSVTNTRAIKVKALKKKASVVQVLASAASNQKQALTILNRLRATLQTGLTGANFKNGSIGASKLK